MANLINPAGIGGGSRYHQGVFKPRHPEKCINLLRPDIFKPPIFRSGWERRFQTWADENVNVVAWGCEIVVISYFCRLKAAQGADRVKRRYFTDFYLEVKGADGKIVKMVIEVKPKKETKLPTEPKRKTAKSIARYDKEVMTYSVNEDKWRQAERFCAAHGMVFKLITEDELFPS